MVTKKKFIRITSKIDGFRRAGMSHSHTPCDYPVEAFSDNQLAQIEAEPNLVVQQIERDVDDGNGGGADQQPAAPAKPAATAKKGASK